MARERSPRVVLTCEHAGNRVPARFARLFEKEPAVLSTHEGWDIGAVGVARALQKALDVPYFEQKLSRLLIDCNRSENNKALFSRFSQHIPDVDRQFLLSAHRGHRGRVTDAVNDLCARGYSVVHLAIHSFCPELRGEVRRCHVGLLYDPRRRKEARLARGWQHSLQQAEPELLVRRNYPYRGQADGLTTVLRKRWADDRYVGLEVELNQALTGDKPSTRDRLAKLLVATFHQAMPRADRRVLSGEDRSVAH